MSMQDSVTVSGGMRSVEDTMDHTNLRHTYDIWLAVAAGQAEDFAESARTAHELRYAQHELRHARQALREAERDLRGAGADQETLLPLRRAIAGLGRLMVVIGRRLEELDAPADEPQAARSEEH